MDTSQRLTLEAFDDAEHFLRKYPNQWNDKQLELVNRLNQMKSAGPNFREKFREATLQCHRHFLQQAEEQRYEEESTLDMDSPSSSILDVYDNRIMARPDVEAPTQDQLKKIFFI